MFIIRHKNIFTIAAALLALLAIASIAVFGLKSGIEFTGGTSIVLTAESESAEDNVAAIIAERFEGSVLLQELGDGLSLRLPFLEEADRSELARELEALDGVSVTELSSVGPTLGSELQRKSFIAVALVIISIVLYIAFAFRQVSKPISSWVFATITIVSLVFDLLITLGIFSVFGALLGAEVDSLFIIALLTVLGYSVNDTIVIFDRIREKLSDAEGNKKKQVDFETAVGTSISETLTRSINTSLTTSLALIALAVFGDESIRIFSLTLLAGVIVGTSSSILLASPLLVLFQKFNERRSVSDKKKK